MNPTTKRLFTTLGLVLLLGGIFLLPDVKAIRPAAVIMNLPTFLGDWRAQTLEESEQVRAILADDTQFEKALYFRPSAKDPGKYDLVYATIVLGGSDPNNSIHRPERCLPAQGNRLEERSEKSVETEFGDKLDVMRLRTTGVVNGVPSLTYYWFIGNSMVTNSHYARTFKDMSDRVLRGYNQRWAYITVSCPYEIENEQTAKLTEEEADALVTGLISKLYPRIVKHEMLLD